jgi:hypothetical protein
MIESWKRFKVIGPFPSERAGFVVFRIKDVMSGDWERDMAGEIMSYSPLSAANAVADALNAGQDEREASVFGPERREHVSFA